MSDTGFALINELKVEGYERPTLDQLIEMGNHGVGVDYVQGLKSYGYQLKTIDYLVKMRDPRRDSKVHRRDGVSGLQKPRAGGLIRIRDHGVTPGFHKRVHRRRLPTASVDEWVTLRDHG